MRRRIDDFRPVIAERVALLNRDKGINVPDVQSAIEELYASTPRATMFHRRWPREPLFNYILKEKLIVKGKGDWYNHMREIGNIIRTKDGDLAVFASGVVDETYTGNNAYIGVSISKDNGETWSNLVKLDLPFPAEDPYCVLHNGTYYLYVDDKSITPFRDIRLYTSQDLVTWEDRGPVLNPSPNAWDNKDVSSPTIIIENGIWYMFYEGRGSGSFEHWGAIGIATSTDGITWTKHENNPIVTPFGGPYRFNKPPTIAFSLAIVPDDIIKVRSRYFMTCHVETMDNHWRPVLLGSENLESGWMFLTEMYASEPSLESVMFYWEKLSLICNTRSDTSMYVYQPGVLS